MATGRTVDKYTRIYMQGSELSYYASAIGPLDCQYAEGNFAALSEQLQGAWLGQATVSPGTLNAILSTEVNGIYQVAPGSDQYLMVALGIQAEPAIGDPVFMGRFQVDDYLLSRSNPVAGTVKFAPSSGLLATKDYSNPWGVLLHTNIASTTDNALDGILDNVLATPASTTDGGYMSYQVISAAGSGNINAVIQVLDGATAGACNNVLLSSGTLTLGSGGVFNNKACGIVALASTASVNKYLRWQVTWGAGGNACSSITFVLGFSRRKA